MEITHEFPVWRERADFIIGARLSQSGISDLATSEQIWARQLGPDIFEICCIPFFAYGLALGDHVRTKTMGNERFVISEVTRKSGHATYRIWLQSSDDCTPMIDELLSFGCSVEVRWKKSRLIAVDAASKSVRAKLESFLERIELEGKGECELGM